MPAIKAVKSKNIQVIDCKFSGFDTDIELENVEGFLSANNQFSQQNPQYLIGELIKSIEESKLDKCSQERLYKEIFSFLSSKHLDEKKGISTKDKIFRYLGNKAVDYFVQLAAAVSAGLILNLKTKIGQ